MEPVYKTDPRPVSIYTIPEGLRVPGLPYKFGMVELTKADIDRARARVKGEFHKLQDEQIKESIVELDGESVKASRHLVESFYDKCGQKIMSLLSIAYNHMNLPQDDDLEAFLSGRETRA